MEDIYLTVFVFQFFFMLLSLINYYSEEYSLILAILSIVFTSLLVSILYFAIEEQSLKKHIYSISLAILGVVLQTVTIIKFYRKKGRTVSS
jgi:hypothetical protein